MSASTAHRLFAKAASAPSTRPAQEPECPASGSARNVSSSSDAVDGGGSGGCPVGGDAAHAARINMAVVANAAPGEQGSRLGTHRQASSIPMAADDQLPSHQEGTTEVWMYPSEQQFFNAMRRKGWQPSEADMANVVAIHNGVNERAWQHVLAWEALHACECPAGPKLLRFRGRPQDYSPKARLLNLLGYKLPFDRHDWVVDRCGTQVRYVIDFYSGARQAGAGASMHLDVRPALDSLQALADRAHMQWLALFGRPDGERERADGGM